MYLRIALERVEEGLTETHGRIAAGIVNTSAFVSIKSIRTR